MQSLLFPIQFAFVLVPIRSLFFLFLFIEETFTFLRKPAECWLLSGPKVPICCLDLLVTNPELFEPWKDHGRNTSPSIPGGACSGLPAEQKRSPQGRKSQPIKVL
jgi:hypothetical protein